MTGLAGRSLKIEGAGAVLQNQTPVPDLSAAVTSLQQILKVERDARLAATLDELWFVIANESRRALQARQIFVLEPASTGCIMRAVSSLSKVERDSPTIRWLERVARDMIHGLADKTLAEMQLSALPAGRDEQAALFPFPQVMLGALRSRRGETMAYLMAVRETPFGDAERAAAERLVESFSHAAEALGAARRRSGRLTRRRLAIAMSAVAAAALAFVPVPMTVLAPAEVVAQDAFVVTAPIEGTIGQVTVEAGQSVKAGDVLARLVDTAQRNQLEIAEQEVAVAEAKWRQISLAAFNDANARRELSVVTSERLLKQAERDYARDLLARTIIRAERDGVAIYADKRELTGRPVQTGQRLMDVADPAKIRIRAQAPLDDAMALQTGGRLRFFPDADPLNPVDATVTETGHQARPTESGSLAFRVDADLPAAAAERLRIGHRGTAQIFGETVSLGFYLLRRPLSAFRQKFGL
jgi:multidrug efflux pump subunit AcrA (membrane-fusion protein)